MIYELLKQRNRVFQLRKQLRREEEKLLVVANQQPLDDLLFAALDVRTVRALKDSNITTLGQVLKRGALEKVPGVGRRNADKIRHILSEKKFFECLDNPYEG